MSSSPVPAASRKVESGPGITVLIVDDHPVVCEGLRSMLTTEPDLTVLGEANSGAEAIEAWRRLRPEVILMDLLLPDMTGTEVISRICKESSDAQIIVLTTLGGDEEIYRALEVGARGYLLKDMARKELMNAIRTVSAGRRYIPSQVGSRLAEGMPRSEVSPRELEVLKLVACGMRNKEIAYELSISGSAQESGQGDAI